MPEGEMRITIVVKDELTPVVRLLRKRLRKLIRNMRIERRARKCLKVK